MATLEELKAQNAAVEAGAIVDPDIVVDPPVVDDPEIDPDDLTDPEVDAAWMQADDKESATGVMPVEKHIRAKRRLKDTIGEKDGRITALEAQVEALTKGKAAPAGMRLLPTLEDCGGDPVKHQEEMGLWVKEAVAVENAEVNTAQAQSNHTAQETQGRDTAVNEHYARSVKLQEGSTITADVFDKAELKVRTSLDEISPGNGDAIADHLIDIMGEGSEKVIYHLGVNPLKMAALQEEFKKDPRGYTAVAMVERIKASIAPIGKRQSRAPAPAKHLSGDQKPVTAGAKALKKKYDAAVKGNNPQGRIDAKRAAKREGVDTSGWS